MNTPTLVVTDLRKRYGETRALDGFSLSVEAASIHGLLGPNGAGKSTAIRALATLTATDSGVAAIDGHDVATAGTRVRERIGLVGQATALDEILSGRQNLVLFGRLLNLGRMAHSRATELLEQFELTDAADKPVSGYSGGMKRRLDIAAALILTPAVLFLDEPTAGLDPRGRNEVWEAVRRVKGTGTTVLLTTQYLDEADQLADRISIMDHGRVIAEGRPSELKRQLGGARVELVIAAELLDHCARTLEAVIGSPVDVDYDNRTLSIAAGAGSQTLIDIVRALDNESIDADDILLRRPTLDEVFLALTAPSTDNASEKESA
ncbi:MAG: ATP-binding cassette domain-containing protein [Homoserinimonas sp.]